MSQAVVRLLDLDPDLAEHLDADSRRRASELVRARVFRVPNGVWQPPSLEADATGFMLLSGLMVRTLHLGPVASAELLGPTDVLRPWENDLIPSLTPTLTDWRVVAEARVALLDGRATAAIGRWPELVSAVSARMLRRARSLAYMMAAQHFIRVEDRVLATLWHLASMWGRVTPEGTVVPFRLTHQMLSQIVGAQRPTTTMAIRSLTEQGRLFADPHRHFVLLGDPPDWRRETTPVLELET